MNGKKILFASLITLLVLFGFFIFSLSTKNSVQEFDERNSSTLLDSKSKFETSAVNASHTVQNVKEQKRNLNLESHESSGQNMDNYSSMSGGDPGESNSPQIKSENNVDYDFDLGEFGIGFKSLDPDSIPGSVRSEFTLPGARKTEFYSLENGDFKNLAIEGGGLDEILRSNAKEPPVLLGFESDADLMVKKKYQVTKLDRAGQRLTSVHASIENWPCSIINIVSSGSDNVQMTAYHNGKIVLKIQQTDLSNVYALNQFYSSTPSSCRE